MSGIRLHALTVSQLLRAGLDGEVMVVQYQPRGIGLDLDGWGRL